LVRKSAPVPQAIHRNRVRQQHESTVKDSPASCEFTRRTRRKQESVSCGDRRRSTDPSWLWRSNAAPQLARSTNTVCFGVRRAAAYEVRQHRDVSRTKALDTTDLVSQVAAQRIRNSPTVRKPRRPDAGIDSPSQRDAQAHNGGSPLLLSR